MIGLLVGAAWAWTDPATGLSVDLPTGWTEVPLTVTLGGAVFQATNDATGGGLVVRALPFDAASLPESVRAKVGDVDAALSADRVAQATALSQDDGSAAHTVYLGLSDVAGARVGRWVFAAAPVGTDPPRLWWQVYWRSNTYVGQIVAWVPADHVAAFVPAMRAVETALSTTDGYAPPAALLFRATGGCDGPASVDRMAAIAASSPFQAATAALATGAWTDNARALTELGALGTLLSATDACVKRAASDVRACEVWERPSDTDRSHALQTAVVACIDADRDVAKAIAMTSTPR